MAKKKKVSESDIIEIYMEDVVKHQVKPISVEDFAKSNRFEASLFYTYFDSFKAVEQTVFKLLFEKALETLEQSEEYDTFDKKNKLISLYYTFFENLTLNREFIEIINNYIL